MINRYALCMISLTVSCVLIFIGCGTVGKLTANKDSSIQGEPIDPFQYGDEFLEFSPNGMSNDAVHREPNTDTRDSAGSGSSEAAANQEHPAIRSFVNPAEPVFGYRIQIGIDENKKRMENLVEKARSSIDLNVYLEFEAPFYRVRVGDFKTRQEAERYVRLLKDNGFKDALWVMSQIAVQ